MQVMAGAADETVKTAAMLANLYYLGRLDARAPGIDLEARLREELARMSSGIGSEDAIRCGALMNDRTLAISEVGNRLLGPAPTP
jgi:hypothetical protein